MRVYLDPQQVAPFFEMSERYGKLYQRMVDVLEKLGPEELDRRAQRRAGLDELPAGTLASRWMDIDATIEPNSQNPASIVESVALHTAALETLIAALAEHDFAWS